MKNTEFKGVITCIIILITSSIITVMAMNNGYYGISLVGMFAAISSFVIFFLFAGRASCLGKMLAGNEVVAAWQYTDQETIGNIKESKEENKGLLVMAVPFFSFVIIVVVLTVGIAAENIGLGLLIVIILIVLNILFFKIAMSIEIKERQVMMNGSNQKKRSVYISESGIYAHGMLHVWRGWGSSLKAVRYDGKKKALDFTYSYLRAYGIGKYTVTVKVPEDKMYLVDRIRNSFLAYWLEG